MRGHRDKEEEGEQMQRQGGVEGGRETWVDNISQARREVCFRPYFRTRAPYKAVVSSVPEQYTPVLSTPWTCR